MFPSGEAGPSWETSGALLLQEGNKYTGWIRLRILAGYKCDSKWLSRITVRQGRRKCSLLAVIVRVELLSSYFYFPRCFSKGTAESFPCLRVCVSVCTWNVDADSRDSQLSAGTWGRGLQEGTQTAMRSGWCCRDAQKCWALWTCTAHSIKVYLSSGLECVCSSAQHQKLSGFHTDRFVFIDLLVLFIQGGFVQVRKGICPWKSLFMMGLRYAQIPHLQQFLFSHVPNKDGCWTESSRSWSQGVLGRLWARGIDDFIRVMSMTAELVVQPSNNGDVTCQSFYSYLNADN